MGVEPIGGRRCVIGRGAFRLWTRAAKCARLLGIHLHTEIALRTRLFKQILTAAIAAGGVVVFTMLALPLPWLLGPIFACLLAALLRAPLERAERLSEGMRTILGVAVGASITPAVFGRLGDMALSLALIPIFILLIGAVGYPYFRRLWRFDKATSFYAAMPGGFQDMVIFGEEAGANVRALSLIHATRVLVIVSALPFLFTLSFGLDLTLPPGAPASELPWREGALMIALALVGWLGGKAIGLFGASILGPLILTAAASLAGLIHYRPPAEAILVAQYFIGLSVGAKYAGVTVEELARVVASAFGFTLILVVLAAGFMEIVFLGALAPPVEAILAFSPGGQAEMAVLAIMAGADLAYVVTHHLARIMIVIIGAPLAMRLLK